MSTNDAARFLADKLLRIPPMKQTIFSIAFVAALAFGIFWVMGGSFETLQNGRWVDLDDYPTNHLDAVLHPDG
jgi:hypothetical protein